MDKIHEVCNNCTEKHCCRGICKEMNDYLVAKRNKSRKTDTRNSRIK